MEVWAENRVEHKKKGRYKIRKTIHQNAQLVFNYSASSQKFEQEDKKQEQGKYGKIKILSGGFK